MANRLRLMTILGTRPEIIRLSETIKACDRFFDHILVHTGQNYDYELNEVFFKDLGLREPDYYLGVAGGDLGETMGNVISSSYKLIKRIKPDAILILGDTNSALSAISAKRLKCPIFHMEAGNRCEDWNVAEMTNRTIVDHISDVNLPYTDNARRHLLEEGIDEKTIFVTGSPMKEVLFAHKREIEDSDVLSRLGLEKKRYIVLSAHREENIDDESNFLSLMNAVNKVARTYKMPVIYSTHPRSKKQIEERGFVFDPLVKSIKPLGLFDYCKLQKEAYLVLSDSGTLTEESAILSFPAVLIRTSTERPEGLDAGTIVIGGIKERDILRASELAVATFAYRKMSPSPYYQESEVSMKVVKIIESYAKIIDMLTWRKRD
ncbi:MAG: UDP-N-acetylglucosamine 2-epimerase (non-hydrolyzing) [Bacilli bacterium]|nr:UDP-N-acetylglucosamine 2-epimerase (non-hydrolyzing) [Bacilli bacterium]